MTEALGTAPVQEIMDGSVHNCSSNESIFNFKLSEMIALFMQQTILKIQHINT
jgi:hypothetical protein